VNADSSVNLFLFSLIIILNIYFLALWFFRFTDVILRLYIDKLKSFRCFKFIFGDRNMENYELNLKKIVGEQYKQKSSYSKRFIAARSDSGKVEDDPAMQIEYKI